MTRITAKTADAITWAMLCHKTAWEHMALSIAADDAGNHNEARLQHETFKNWSRYRDESLIKAFGLDHMQLNALARKSWPRTA